jgi:hypothetical protein
VEFTAFAADVAVIAGILFAYIQIRQSRDIERCRVAMTAIEPTRSAPFLESYHKLKALHADDSALPSTELREPLYYVLNAYDNIAILCLRGLADTELVKASTYLSMKELVPILDSMKLPSESRTNIDLLLARFDHKTAN